MDYIFRWLQLRFLTGQQQALFDGLRPKYMGGVAPVSAPDENGHGQQTFGDLVEGSPNVADNRQLTTDNFPVGGTATGHHHAADALKELIDMGDAPSCSVCGSIMTRNGSCYRCMSCGSTSGCS
jgi:ribonucleoside-diphosphate reductase alpha chain